MLGKTNIIFVEKDQSTGMQFIKEFISTKTTENIVEMKFLNGTLFALTDKHVLYGQDADSLDYVTYEDTLLEVNDVQFFEGRYIFFNRNKWFKNDQPAETLELSYYTGTDPSSLEAETFTVALEKCPEQDGVLLRAEVSSEGKLIFLIRCTWKDASITKRVYILQTMSGWDAEDKTQVVINDSDSSRAVADIFFMRDRFLVKRTGTSTAQTTFQVLTLEGMIAQAYSGPSAIIGDIAYYIISDKVYYSINFADTVLIRSPKNDTISSDPQKTTQIIPIGGRIGLYSRANILWLADSLSDIKDEMSVQIELDRLSDYNIYSFVEANGYTYLGCKSGIITKCYLDVEGDYQAPEVVLVKTLAARQALSQAREYTDQRITELEKRITELENGQ